MPASVVFFVFLFIALIVAFFILLPKARDNVVIPPRQTEQAPEVSAQPPQPQEPAAPRPQETVPAQPETAPPDPQEAAQAESPAEQPTTPPASPAAETAPETRDRGVYFIQVEGDGAELRLLKANRRLSVSDSPLLDCINALIAGPTAGERNSGLLSFIPPGTRLISAMVRGNTAYLSFNEEFQYNPSGREGAVAQVRQVVWTATEFPNIHDVQILIEGSRVDFLSEGVMIGSPIGR